jgi:hypothetical protein
VHGQEALSKDLKDAIRDVLLSFWKEAFWKILALVLKYSTERHTKNLCLFNGKDVTVR